MRSYKTRLHPTQEQKDLIKLYIKGTHVLYNFFIQENISRVEKGDVLLDAYTFNMGVYKHLKESQDYRWLQAVPFKTRNEALYNANNAFKRFDRGLSSLPNFKSRRSRQCVAVHGDTITHRDRVKIPFVGVVRLSEYGYLPTDSQLQRTNASVKACYISVEAGYYYISIRTNERPSRVHNVLNQTTIGIDLGITCFAQLSDGTYYPKFTSTKQFKHKQRRIKMLKRRLNRQVIGSNRYNQTLLHLQRAYRKLNNFTDFVIKYYASRIINKMPMAITMEDFTQGFMMKSKNVTHKIQHIAFYDFKIWMQHQCHKNGIEYRQAGKYFKSTKTCSSCHQVNKKQFQGKEADALLRIFICPSCNLQIDRDLNAAINLKLTNNYKILYR